MTNSINFKYIEKMLSRKGYNIKRNVYTWKAHIYKYKVCKNIINDENIEYFYFKNLNEVFEFYKLIDKHFS